MRTSSVVVFLFSLLVYVVTADHEVSCCQDDTCGLANRKCLYVEDEDECGTDRELLRTHPNNRDTTLYNLQEYPIVCHNVICCDSADCGGGCREDVDTKLECEFHGGGLECDPGTRTSYRCCDASCRFCSGKFFFEPGMCTFRANRATECPTHDSCCRSDDCETRCQSYTFTEQDCQRQEDNDSGRHVCGPDERDHHDDHHDSSMTGDPHVKSWTGEYSYYMGECDLVLIHVAGFDDESGQDLTVHARTTLRYQYSYIETAAIRIGNDTLEVSSWGEYAINGVESANMMNAMGTRGGQPTAAKIATLGGYPVFHTIHSKKTQSFDIALSNNNNNNNHQNNITLAILKDIVSVKIHGASREQFGNTVGLLGSFDGKLLGRDGVTEYDKESRNALGQEWQVRGEPLLFRTIREPQYPQACRLPTESTAQREARRLGEGIIEEQAKVACAHVEWDPQAYEACVYDVTVMNDLDQAMAYY